MSIKANGTFASVMNRIDGQIQLAISSSINKKYNIDYGLWVYKSWSVKKLIL
jgi:hypothetical protein